MWGHGSDFDSLALPRPGRGNDRLTPSSPLQGKVHAVVEKSKYPFKVLQDAQSLLIRLP